MAASMSRLEGASVLVLGAGYVGQSLVARLTARNATVFTLSRHPRQPQPREVCIVADVTERTSLRQVPRQLDFVVYLVGPDAATDAAYRAAYVEGLQNLLSLPAASGASIKRVIFASSTAVYAHDNGGWVDETSETFPTRFSGQRLLEAERLLAGAGLPSTSLRFAGIYGPGRQRLLNSVLGGEARLSPKSSFTNRIHRDDCAGVIEHLLELENAEPLYLGVDSEPAELNDILSWLANASGAEAPAFDPHHEPKTRGGNKRCSNRRLLRTGYQLLYPSFREGYRALLSARTA